MVMVLLYSEYFVEYILEVLFVGNRVLCFVWSFPEITFFVREKENERKSDEMREKYYLKPWTE
jgi:hypothetical protein